MTVSRIWSLALLTISIITFNQCSSHYSQSDTDIIFSFERASAKTSPISFQIPHGWRVIDANDSTFIDLWMISDDYKSSLSLIPLHSDEEKQSYSNWISVSKLSNKMKFKNAKIEIIGEEPVDINGIHCDFYYFKTEDSFYRISLFKFNEKFYELTALGNILNDNISSQLEFLTQIQNVVIGSISKL